MCPFPTKAPPWQSVRQPPPPPPPPRLSICLICVWSIPFRPTSAEHASTLHRQYCFAHLQPPFARENGKSVLTVATAVAYSPVFTNLNVTLLCDLRISFMVGLVQSRRMPRGVAILTAGGPREPPRAPRQPKNLRSLFLTVAARARVRLGRKWYSISYQPG